MESKDGIEGLVGFPSMMDGRVVFLSWKLDETEVLHWHEIEEDFSGRQPLVVATRTGGPLDGGDIGSDS